MAAAIAAMFGPQFCEDYWPDHHTELSRQGPDRRGPCWGSASSSEGARSRSGSTPRPASGPRIACAASPPAAGASRWSGGSPRSTASAEGGRPTSRWPTPPRYSRSLMSGCAAGCGRSGGRSGSARRPDGATCNCWESRRNRLANGPFAQGPLAKRTFRAPAPRLAQRLLAPTGTARVHRSLPPSPGRDANRRMRTRTSGGVGGAGVSPAPTRLVAACRGFGTV